VLLYIFTGISNTSQTGEATKFWAKSARISDLIVVAAAVVVTFSDAIVVVVIVVLGQGTCQSRTIPY
jgi:hypothetical protein